MARKRRRTRAQEHAAVLRANRHLYEPLTVLQGGQCAICPKPIPGPGERRFPLDHDHKTMEIRGVLCVACNLRLTGRCTVEWMEAAIEYLKNPPARSFS